MTKPKIGRPTKEEALTKAIEAFGGVGIDHNLIDPRRVLAAIATNPASSESGRIRACIVLLGGLVADYERRQANDRRDQASDDDLRRRWDEVDDDERARLVDGAKANYFALLGG